MTDTADTPTQRVQLAYAWTDPDGTDHEPDEVVDVDVIVARQLLDGGRARMPDDEKSDETDRGEVGPDGTTAVTAEETRRTSARGSSKS
jgi:hypothetical protein